MPTELPAFSYLGSKRGASIEDVLTSIEEVLQRQDRYIRYLEERVKTLEGERRSFRANKKF